MNATEQRHESPRQLVISSKSKHGDIMNWLNSKTRTEVIVMGQTVDETVRTLVEQARAYGLPIRALPHLAQQLGELIAA